MILHVCRITDEQIDLLRETGKVGRFIFDGEEDEDKVDIDKAWHGIHYLLTGSASGGEPPLDFLLSGGEVIGADEGHGPPRAFTSEEVAAIWKALEGVDADKLREHYDGVAMTRLGIYPESIWSHAGQACDEADYPIKNFVRLRRLIARAVEQDEGLLLGMY